jgi:hypothetical protein
MTTNRNAYSAVIAGLDPAIHPHPSPPPLAGEGWEGDARVKPAYDALNA